MKEYVINERELYCVRIVFKLIISLAILMNMNDFEQVIMLLLLMNFC